MQTQIDMMTKALLGEGSSSPDQTMSPMGMKPQGQQQNSLFGGSYLPQLMGQNPQAVMQMLGQQYKTPDGDPNAPHDTPSPGNFTPGGQTTPGGTSVTPF